MLFLFSPSTYSTWVRRSMLYTEFLQCLALVKAFLFTLTAGPFFFFFFFSSCVTGYPYLLLTSLLSCLASEWPPDYSSFLLLLEPLFLFLHLQNFLLRTRTVFSVAENLCPYCHKEEQLTTSYFIC